MEKKTTSRRGLLKLGIAAAGGAALAPGAILAQTRSEQSSAAVVTARRFRGWVSRGAGEGRTTFQELTLRPISGRQVVVRTEPASAKVTASRRVTPRRLIMSSPPRCGDLEPLCQESSVSTKPDP